MCGIVGIRSKNKHGFVNFENIDTAVNSLKHRGPDSQQSKQYTNVSFGHTRLAVIDTESGANQPFEDDRYSLVFNGEFYNYKDIRKAMVDKGLVFETKSDTEVLFKLLIEKREKALEEINGCFAFAFYDRLDDYMLIARDRLGIKPLYIYEDENQVIFSSEVKTLLSFEIDKTLNFPGIANYFRLTYFNEDRTIFKNVKKLRPGYFYEFVGEKEPRLKQYYELMPDQKYEGNYEYAQFELRNRLNTSVQRRLVSDVPLGTFLSGGVDSTIVSALAKYQKHDLKTFSIGFEHEYFDETEYARIAAKRIGSVHEEIVLGKKEFRENFEDFLNSLDEPFGDSSSFAMFLLSKYAKKHVTVCLSGDGADELFGGYRKHFADYYIRTSSKGKKRLINLIGTLASPISTSRSNSMGDKSRKIQKLKNGMQLSADQRYYEWCTFISEKEKNKLLAFDSENGYDEFYETSAINSFEDLNDTLFSDQKMVLPNDMLKKVDLMSMANSLEVRTPFLDHLVVDFVNSLPAEYKVHELGGKRILKDTFRNELPEEIINRPKSGFEIPIEEWLGDFLIELFNDEMFSESFIKRQGIFNWDTVERLKNQDLSAQGSDKIYLIWSLIIFQYWYKNNLAE